MNIRKISKFIKKIMPMSIFNFVRIIGTAILTPILFSLQTGHFRSALLKKAVDKNGEPLPWYTYPAIEFLSDKNFERQAVLEWGSGQSTLWWAKKVLKIDSFESNVAWYQKVKKLLPSNGSIYLVPDNLDNYAANLTCNKYDVIVIDGLNRLKCAQVSIDLISVDGAIILDNSEGFWGEEGRYPILDLYRSRGFQRIDFFGYCPGVVEPHCTSLFFKSKCFLFEGAENPRGYMVR